jgi:hypothetical protein
MTYAALAQMVGFLALSVGALSFQFKDQKKLFMVWTCSDLIWVIHYLMISAITPALTVSVAAVRTALVIFVMPQAKTPVIGAALFCSTALCILAAEGQVRDYLPILTSFIFSAALYYNAHYGISRGLIGIGKLIWLIIGILFVSYAEITASLIGILSLLIGVYRHKFLKVSESHSN